MPGVRPRFLGTQRHSVHCERDPTTPEDRIDNTARAVGCPPSPPLRSKFVGKGMIAPGYAIPLFHFILDGSTVGNQVRGDGDLQCALAQLNSLVYSYPL